MALQLMERRLLGDFIVKIARSLGEYTAVLRASSFSDAADVKNRFCPTI